MNILSHNAGIICLQKGLSISARGETLACEATDESEY